MELTNKKEIENQPEVGRDYQIYNEISHVFDNTLSKGSNLTEHNPEGLECFNFDNLFSEEEQILTEEDKANFKALFDGKDITDEQIETLFNTMEPMDILMLTRDTYEKAVTDHGRVVMDRHLQQIDSDIHAKIASEEQED